MPTSTAPGNTVNRPAGALCSVVLIFGTATASFASSQAPDRPVDSTASMELRVAALEAEVARLEAGRDQAWLTEARATEIRALVADVLADADTRASLLQPGATAGHDGAFFIASADGGFRLNIDGRLQIRYVYNHQSDSPTDRHRSGFENRRTQFAFSGHVVSPDWTYKIQGRFDRDGGVFDLLDAVMAYRFNDQIAVRAGQFRPGFLREDSTSSTRQLTVDRSLVNARFAQNRVQGVELLVRAGDRVRLSGAFSDGFRSLNTASLVRRTEFAFTGRAEFLAAGEWSQFRDFTSWPGESFGLLFGAAAHWQRDEFGTPDLEVDFIRWTVDASAEFGGANLFAAFIGNHVDTRGGGNATQWGLVAQGGFFIVPDRWELFARWEWGDADLAGVTDLSVLTVGATRFFNRHRLKWTTDVGYGFNEVASFWSSGSAGWRADSPGEDGQIVIRSQLQLVF